jgi:hypothetical protein
MSVIGLTWAAITAHKKACRSRRLISLPDHDGPPAFPVHCLSLRTPGILPGRPTMPNVKLDCQRES